MATQKVSHNPPPPQVIGNATRGAGLDYNDQAQQVAKDHGFDVAMLNHDGTPAWAAAYTTDEYTENHIEFDPGEDADKYVDCDEVDADDA